VDRRHLARVDAQLGAESVATRPSQVGQQALFVIDLRRDSRHWRRQAGDTRGDRKDAGGMQEAICAVGDIRVEVERVVECAKDQSGDAFGASDVPHVRGAARAFDQREYARLRDRSPNVMHLRRGLGLGQHHAGHARIAQQTQVVAERA
jgi:hypothetical protein